VVRFAERPDAPGPGLVNAGVYLLRRQALDACAPNCSFEREVMPGLAASGAMRAIVRDGYFIDIGLPESLASAQAELNDRRRRPGVLLSPGAVFDRGGDGARRWIEGAPQAIGRLNDAGLYVFLAGEGDRAGLDADLQAVLCDAGGHVDQVLTGDLSDVALTWPIRDGAVKVLADRAAVLAAAGA
jgi:D-glycero-D-manno-heptose 1,7-bisphosphate phosphatase